MVDISRLPDPEDPETALAAVIALRRLADGLERRAVRSALRQGWSWARIAQALGVTKQAAHKRLSDIVASDDSP
uniref:hypothetical protein n=1 Tax=Shinella sp. TaxID=1870904 RepID=UPI0040369416